MGFLASMPFHTVPLRRFGGLYTEADPRDLPAGASPVCQDCDFQLGGLIPRAGQTQRITGVVGAGTIAAGWLAVSSAQLINGLLYTMLQDGSGQLWYEDVANHPGQVTLLENGTSVGRALFTNAFGRVYIGLSDFTTGNDQPRQWDGTTISRITQEGPGTAPTPFTPPASMHYACSAYQFGAALSVSKVVWGSSLSGNTPGTNLYLLFAAGSSGNITQFQNGDYVYIAGLPNLGSTNVTLNGTYQVVFTGSVGTGASTQEYLQVVVREASYAAVPGLSGVTVQRTRAALFLNEAQPGGSDAYVGGATVVLSQFPGAILNHSFKIAVPGLVNLYVTNTSLTSNIAALTCTLYSGRPPWWVASYNYPLGAQIAQKVTSPTASAAPVWIVVRAGFSGASAPAWPVNPANGTQVTDNGVTWQFVPNAEILISVAHCTNGGNVFNVSQVPIVSADTGVVSVAVTNANVSSAADNGTATAGGGFSFEFEPAVWALGQPSINPIFTSATGNVSVIGASGHRVIMSGSMGRPDIFTVRTDTAHVPPAIPPAARTAVVNANPITRFTTLPRYAPHEPFAKFFRVPVDGGVGGNGVTGDGGSSGGLGGIKAHHGGHGPHTPDPVATYASPPNAEPFTETVPSALGDVAAGPRWVVALFVTNTGFISPASPPRQFTPVGGYVEFGSLPTGPPNVIARVLAITHANAGVGGPYYYIPEDVLVGSKTVADTAAAGTSGTTSSAVAATPAVPQSSPVVVPATRINSTVVWDNTSATTGVLTLSDTVLAASVDITADGGDYLRTRELAPFVGCLSQFGRMFYWGERNKVEQFVNLTFNGGYAGSTSTLPAGWQSNNQNLAFYQVRTSNLFANNFELFIENSSGAATLNPNGTALASRENLSQTAYQTPWQSPIIMPNTGYGARVILRAAAVPASGSFVVELYSPSAAQSWPATFALAGLTAGASTELKAAFANPAWATVPNDLELRIYANQLPPSAAFEVERIEVYDTAAPVLGSRVAVSYANNPEAVDSVTGVIDVSNWTAEPVRAVFSFLDSLYIATDSHTFATVDNGATEPAQWTIKPLAGQIGCAGPLAWALGQEHVFVADRRGVYIFDGGNHVKISAEVQSLWNTLYQSSLQNVWLLNDLANQRLLVGTPFVLPSTWIGGNDAAPAYPNTVLLLNYYNLPSAAAIADSVSVTVSMFTGSLLFRDGRRKWVPWTIPAAVGAFVGRADGSREIWLGARASTLMGKLDPTAATDNGAAIPQSYTTFDWSDELSEAQMQLGNVRKQYAYLTINAEGAGGLVVTAYPESLGSQWPVAMPAVTLASAAQDDVNLPLNVTGNRMFLRLATDGAAGSHFKVKEMVVAAAASSRIPVTGR